MKVFWFVLSRTFFCLSSQFHSQPHFFFQPLWLTLFHRSGSFVSLSPPPPIHHCRYCTWVAALCLGTSQVDTAPCRVYLIIMIEISSVPKWVFLDIFSSYHRYSVPKKLYAFRAYPYYKLRNYPCNHARLPVTPFRSSVLIILSPCQPIYFVLIMQCNPCQPFQVSRYFVLIMQGTLC